MAHHEVCRWRCGTPRRIASVAKPQLAPRAPLAGEDVAFAIFREVAPYAFLGETEFLEGVLMGQTLGWKNSERMARCVLPSFPMEGPIEPAISSSPRMQSVPGGFHRILLWELPGAAVRIGSHRSPAVAGSPLGPTEPTAV